MFKRLVLLALFSILVLALPSCGGQTAPEKAKPAAATPPPKPAEPEGPFYELTKDQLTDHPDWTSRNITILGAKLGDRTTQVEKNFGKLDRGQNLRTDYLTIYQNNGLFVYTFPNTGKARRFEVNTRFAHKISDAKLKKLLSVGDLNSMRQALGMEE